MTWKSSHDLKFSGDEPGVTVIVKGRKLQLARGDRVFVTHAAIERAKA